MAINNVQRNLWIRRALSIVLLAVLLYFFLPLIGEIREAGNLLRHADWAWLLVALVVQVISYVFLTWLNVLALRPFPGRIGFGPLAALLAAMAFIQIAVPSAGASGMALRVRMLGRFGYSPEASLFSLVVETLAEALALASVAVFGVAFLLQVGRLTASDIAWSLLLAVTGLLLVWGSWRVVTNREISRRGLLWLISFWNRAAARLRQIDMEQIETRLDEFQEYLAQYRQVPFWKFVLASYGKVILDAATLGACFLMFRYWITPATLLTGYGLILSFSGLAALPGGLGMADASVPVFFSWLRVPGAVALTSGLMYRLIAFWLLRFVGFFTWQYLEARREEGEGGRGRVGE